MAGQSNPGHDSVEAAYVALGVRVGAVERDIGEVNDRLLGLDTKIDKGIAGLASEFRSSLSSLTTQLSERNRTPWAVLIAAAGFIVAVLGTVGSQALAPVRDNVKTLQDQIVPREEINYRSTANDKRLSAIEADIRLSEQRRYDLMIRNIDRLENENRAIRGR